MTNTESLNASLARIFEEIRSTSGISVNALAIESGVPQPTLRRKLRNQTPLTTIEIENVARALGVPLATVLDRAAPQPEVAA